MSDWSNDLYIEVIKDYLKECAEDDDYHYEQYQIDVLLHEFERINNIINKIEKKLYYLLENDTIEIDGKKYYKQQSDDIITRYLLKELKEGK